MMARILFIYAKLNPGLKYVQGMNEILAPLFYVFSKSETVYKYKYKYRLLMKELKMYHFIVLII